METNLNQKKRECIGWICLDIDGTITDQVTEIPHEVLDFLTDLNRKGWNLIFVTGRTFLAGANILKPLNFDYHYAPQNGASWYEMPSRRLGSKKYLHLDHFLSCEHYLEKSGLGFVLVSGIEEGNQRFYRPSKLSDEMNRYFKEELSQLGGEWVAVDSFHNLSTKEFPCAKVYGSEEQLKPLQTLFESSNFISTHLVRDCVNHQLHVLQVTRNDVDKGKAALEIIGEPLINKPIISAGNDFNDETLLAIGDIKIAMENSPRFLIEMADITAPSVSKMGIIPALKLAITQIKL